MLIWIISVIRASAAAVSSSLSSVSDPPSYTELASSESLYIMLNLNFNLNVFVFVVCESIASGALLAQRFGRTSTHTHTSSSYTNANTNLTLASIKTWTLFSIYITAFTHFDFFPSFFYSHTKAHSLLLFIYIFIFSYVSYKILYYNHDE